MAAAMNTVCQKCGEKGDLKLLVFCILCHTSAEHRYCLDKLPEDDHEEVIWTCHECTPDGFKLGPSPSRKSQRILAIKERAEVRKNTRKLLRKASIIRRQVNADRLVEATELRCQMSKPNEKITKMLSISENCGSQEFRRHRRRLLLSEEESSDEESEPPKVTAYQSTPNSHEDLLNPFLIRPSLECTYYVPAHPVDDQIWSGHFNIRNQRNGLVVKLAAHLSSKACSKVVDAASALPAVLDLEILPKADSWPKIFETSPPTDDTIALYFLPEYEKDENDFDMLLDDMINGDLAIKTVIDNVELLIFSSRELPTEHWRLERKYYLWAVFRQRQ